MSKFVSKSVLSMLVILALGACSAPYGKVVPLVPESLQGDWIVASSPNPYSSTMMPDMILRIDASTLLYRYHKESGLKGVYDQSGKPWKEVKDADGKEYFEKKFSLAVRTNTTPWQIDRWDKGEDGTVLKEEGICRLQGDTLILSIGGVGKPRPTSFDDPKDIGAAYSVMKATRAKRP
jgi:uncharacterized protein (TIGR03067 family)